MAGPYVPRFLPFDKSLQGTVIHKAVRQVFPPAKYGQQAVHLYLVHADLVDPHELLRLIWDPGYADHLQPGPGLFLFFTNYASLDAWEPPNDLPKQQAKLGTNLPGGADTGPKENAFTVRMLSRYGLGRLIPIWNRFGTTHEILGELKARLLRIHDREKKVWDLREALASIREDARQLQILAQSDVQALARRLGGSVGEDLSELSRFLDVLRALHQLGRRPHRDAEVAIQNATGWGRIGSVLLREDTNAHIEALGRNWRSREHVKGLKQAQGTLRCYEQLRDLEEWLAFGSAWWGAKLKTMRVLIIDEVLAQGTTDPVSVEMGKEIRGKLRQIVKAFREQANSTEVQFEYLDCEDVFDPLRDWLRDGDGTLGPELPLRSLDGAEVTDRRSLLDYDIVLVEVEFRNHYAGPRIVRLLSACLDRLEALAPASLRKPDGDGRPSIIVLSQSANFEHVQQCLNLGADAYVRKERIFELPMRAVRARIRRRRGEHLGQKSNFRALYALLPERIASLQSLDSPEAVFGQPGDAVDAGWLRALPKTDLHTHIGTCVDLRTIEALAFNTVGHLIARRVPNPSLRSDLEKLTGCVLLLVATARALHVRAHAGTPPWTSLQHALHLVLGAAPKDKEEAGRSEKERKNVYAQAIDRLAKTNRHVNRYEITALLICAVRLLSDDDACREPLVRRWEYLAVLRDMAARQEATVPGADSERGERWLGGHFSRIAFLLESISNDLFDAERGHASRLHASAVLNDRHHRVQERLKQVFETMAALVPEALSASPGGSEYEKRATELREQGSDWIPATMAEFREAAGKAQQSLDFTLEVLVRVPEGAPPEQLNLLDYLRGTELLGADHLQYSENLLLAALSVAEQMRDDNVWYCELRCETIGYTAAGMGAINATDLLCLGLDVATASLNRSREPAPWTRFNLLLGAKRHKSKEKFRQIVELVEYYLQQSPSGRPTGTPQPPEWWRPCQVVGFDMSGDESVEVPEAETLIRPLFLHSAPITIHAGEAMSAESIWGAVYVYRARRIGHGLRLREDPRLLNYCVDEGICMELCPISNEYTNAFPSPGHDYDSDWREYFPLRHYLERGLDVCINTDNRQLHSCSTLTDDYMCAARLTGGLSRWEILRIVKAGFKHAFLPKREIQGLLRAVEHEVYDLVTP